VRQPCLGKIIFLLKCLFIYVGGIYWYAMDINFSLFLLCNGDISLGILLVRFLFILCCTQAVFRVYFVHLLLSLVLFILGLNLWELFWRAGSYIFCLCEAPLCGVSGRYNLFECWPGVGGGAVRVFLGLR